MMPVMMPPIAIPASELEALHLIVAQTRDRRRNIRRTLEIAEVVPAEDKAGLNHLFLWRPRTDSFEKLKEPRRYLEELNLHTGMTEAEAKSDLKERQGILTWMLRKKVDAIEQVGGVMQAYYADSDAVAKLAESDGSPSKIL